MGQPLRWSQLGIGFGALVGIVGLAVTILTVGRIGGLRGETMRLYVVAGGARGVIRGADVWLDGQRIGLVRSVSFAPPSAPTSERIVLALDIRRAAQEQVRFDSRVQIRAGASMLGDKVVYVESGTPRARPVVDGDTLRALEQNDNEGLSSEAALATREFPGIIENVKLLSAGLQAAEGTLGALGANNGRAELRRIRANTARLRAALSSDEGSLGLLRDSSDALRARVTRALAQVDSIKTLMASEQHSFGRFRRDSTIARDLSHAHDELMTLRRIMSAPSTSISRIRADSAVIRAIRRDLAAIDSLRADMKKHPLRYIRF